MIIFEIIKVAFDSLRNNKLRSTLTVLGIVVGIFSIISISTVVSMLQKSIEEGVSALSKNTFQIQKWPAVGNGTDNWAKIRNRKDLRIEDYERLKDKLSGKASVGAEDWQGGKLAKYENKETNPNIQTSGLTPEAFPNNEWEVSSGRIINKRDIRSYSKVIVIGDDIRNTLFGEYSDPLGKEINIDGIKWTIIGVLDTKQGGMFGSNQGNYAFMPISAYQMVYGSRNRSLNLTVKVNPDESYDDVLEQADGFMRTIRKVPPGEERDYDIYSNESVLTQINDITSNVKYIAYGVGLIALLAAGVGIMNIMLVSVTERTREIGIRKAIGAKRMNILTQFIVEAISLCLFGGFLGIVLGILLGNIAGSFLNATAVIPMDWVLIGFILCVFIGVLFGTYPAYKAANLDPIEALRYE